MTITQPTSHRKKSEERTNSSSFRYVVGGVKCIRHTIRSTHTTSSFTFPSLHSSILPSILPFTHGNSLRQSNPLVTARVRGPITTREGKYASIAIFSHMQEYQHYAYNMRWQITRLLSIISREAPGRKPKWADYHNWALGIIRLKKDYAMISNT